jgi:hypothetical protein
MRLYCILQLAVFDCYAFTCTPSCSGDWDPGHRAIFSYTVYSFDPERARKLHPNPCHRAFVPHPSARCLRLLPIYPHVRSPRRCCASRHHAICYNTVLSFDPAETSAVIAIHSLPPWICTASFSLMSSSSAHLPVRPFAKSMPGSKTSCHLTKLWRQNTAI